MRSTIKNRFQPKKDAHENVNEGLMQKVAETVSLEQKLDLARGKNRKAIHKLERHKTLTETAKGYIDGPESQESKFFRQSYPYIPRLGNLSQGSERAVFFGKTKKIVFEFWRSRFPASLKYR